MTDYVIYTDTACDLDPKMLDEKGVKYISMYFSGCSVLLNIRISVDFPHPGSESTTVNSSLSDV